MMVVRSLTATDQVVLITGAAGGIGQACAEIFAKNQNDVILADLPSQEETLLTLAEKISRAHGVRVIPLTLDVTRPRSIKNALDVLVTVYGMDKVNILVNNAGKSLISTVEELNLDQASEIIDIMLKGPINMTVSCLPFLRAALPRASIIFVSSLAAIITPPLLGIYAAAKLGMDKVVETWRFELEPQGYHLGLIHVGATLTGIVRKGYISPTIASIFRQYDECHHHEKLDEQCRRAQKVVKFFERDDQVSPFQVAETIFNMVQHRKKHDLVTKKDGMLFRTKTLLTKLAKKEFQALVNLISNDEE